jgi:cytochrome b6-f complex iron-sulfur subunit
MTTLSVDSQKPVPVNRRRFLKWLIGVSAAITAAGGTVIIFRYLLPPERDETGYAGPTEVGSLAEFPPNAAKVVPVAGKPVIVVNTVSDGLKAYSAICTHLGCIVKWHPDRQLIISPCHNGIFNPVNGNVISGPPPRALPAYEWAVKDGRVYVGRPLGQIYGT